MLQDTIVSENSATQAGGGAFIRTQGYPGAPALLSNVTFDRNAATRGGGVAFGDNSLFAGTVLFDGGSVTNNTATGSGGGVYGGAYTLQFQGTTIAGNHATQNGGGLSTGSASGRAFASLSFVGATIAENSAGSGAANEQFGVGGGIHIVGTLQLSLLQTSVSQNSARVGGGIARIGQGGLGGTSPSGPTSAIDSTISGNTALLHGAGIYQIGGSLSLLRSTIASNIAASSVEAPVANGGGIFVRATDVTLQQSSLIGNSSLTGRGGGLFLDQSGDLTITSRSPQTSRGKTAAASGAVQAVIGY
jgi:predicted outer membrane repeat protein